MVPILVGIIVVLLGVVLGLAVWVVRLRTGGRERQFRDLIEYGRRDLVTGLANRAELFRQLAAAMRSDLDRWAYLVDLDGFKWVNDTLGHEGGDLVLRDVAQRLAEAVESGATVARLGGDEFMVVDVPGGSFGETVGRLFAAPVVTYGGEPVRVGASVGRAWLGEYRSPKGVLRAADAALYEAKRRPDRHRDARRGSVVIRDAVGRRRERQGV